MLVVKWWLNFSIARQFAPLLAIELNFNHRYTYIKGFSLNSDFFFFYVYDSDCGWQSVEYIWKKVLTPSSNLGCPYDSKNACNYNFHFIYAQTTMSNNQNKGERGKEVRWQWHSRRPHNCDMGLWGRICHIFAMQKRRKYHVDIACLSKDLLYKEIPMTFYVNIEHVMKRKRVFIAWVHNGVKVKYLPCAFEGIYVLNLINMPKDLLYENIHGELRIYDTHDYFSTIWPLKQCW